MNIVNFTPIESLLGGLIIGLAVAILISDERKLHWY